MDLNSKIGKEKMEQAIFVVKILLEAYVLTALLLLLLSFFLYKFSLSEKIVSICIIVIYVIATFFAGFVTGKKKETKKFLWGLLMGSLYFLFLLIVSLILNHGVKDLSSNFFSVLSLCIGGGMLGGMLA